MMSLVVPPLCQAGVMSALCKYTGCGKIDRFRESMMELSFNLVSAGLWPERRSDSTAAAWVNGQIKMQIRLLGKTNQHQLITVPAH